MILDLATRQDVQELKALLEQLLTSSPLAAPAAATELLTLDEVAAYTRFDRRTVRQWVTKGRFDARGRRVYLPVLQFNELLRFRRADVEAFGLGTGVLESPLAGQQQPQPIKQKPAGRKRPASVPSVEALKVA